jgi:hypothetical protein
MSQYIIDFKDSVSKADIDLYLGDIGATIVKTFNAFKNAYVVESPTQPATSDIIECIIQDDEHPVTLLGEVVMMDNMALLQQDTSTYTKQLLTSDDNQWWKLYCLDKVDLDQPSIDLPIKGKGATIYLVDSGIKKDHPEFADADIVDLFSITSDYNDNKGHGTALASIMVGKTCGITNATVKNVKLFDPNVPTKQSDMLAAFDAIFNDFSVNPTKLGIVNCSWAITRNLYIENKIQILIDEGIFVVCAAGNSSTVIGNVTPASMRKVIVVGAYDSDFKPCDFSNYSSSSTISVTEGQSNGGELTGWAPGKDIWTATLNDNYGNASGTSLSAAIHSAILARELSDYIIEGEYTNGYVTSISGKLRYFGRNGILHLSSVYDKSINRVSTFMPKKFHVLWKDMADTELLIKSEQNQTFVLKNTFFMTRILNPAKVKSAEILPSLPDGLVLNKRGELRGIVTPISEPNYVVKDVVINITNLDDTITSLNFKFIIKSENMTDISTMPMPTDDPVINYQLMYPSSDDGYCCPGGCSLAPGTVCNAAACFGVYYEVFDCPPAPYGACFYYGVCLQDNGTKGVYCNCYSVNNAPA